MSLQATELRRERRAWAVAGSSHDRLIAVLRIVLPAAVGVLGAFLALAPLTGHDISFMLSKDKVDVASERMRVTSALYRGRDGKGQPFQLTAASAVQATSQDPIVRLQTLNARLEAPDGPTTITGGYGRYDMDTARIAIDGPVTLHQTPDSRVDTSNVLVDLSTRRAVSRGPATGSGALGTFSAARMRADLAARVINLDGRARLHIFQARSRGAR